MKKSIYLLIISISLSVIACSNDNDDTEDELSIDTSLFKGEWFSEDNDSYMIMNVSSYSKHFYVGLDSVPKEAMHSSGSWLFYPTNRRIRMNNGSYESFDYQLVSIDPQVMVLFDLNLNKQFTYYKIVETKDLMLGESYDFTKLSFQPSNYESKGKMVAKVNEGGQIKATAPGTAFVSAKDNSNGAFVKINVGKRLDSYLNEVRNCTTDDIIAKYGAPDTTGVYNALYSFISYKAHVNDTGLRHINYLYNLQNKHIVNIDTYYKDEDSYKQESQYIRENYFDIGYGLWGHLPIYPLNQYLFYLDDSRFIIGYEI